MPPRKLRNSKKEKVPGSASGLPSPLLPLRPICKGVVSSEKSGVSMRRSGRIEPPSRHYESDESPSSSERNVKQKVKEPTRNDNNSRKIVKPSSGNSEERTESPRKSTRLTPITLPIAATGRHRDVPGKRSGALIVDTPRKFKTTFSRPSVSLLDRLDASFAMPSVSDDNDAESSSESLAKDTSRDQQITSRKAKNSSPATPPQSRKQVRIVRKRKQQSVSPGRSPSPSKQSLRPLESKGKAELKKPRNTRQNQQKKKPAITFPSKKGKKMTPSESSSSPRKNLSPGKLSSPRKRSSPRKISSPTRSPSPTKTTKSDKVRPSTPFPQRQHNISISQQPRQPPRSSASGAPYISRSESQLQSAVAGPSSRSQMHSASSSQSLRHRHPSIFESIRKNALNNTGVPTSVAGGYPQSRRVDRDNSPPPRYVGNNVFGNYNMMKHNDISSMLNILRPDHGLNDDQVELLSIRINHMLEDFFVYHCEETQYPYGFITFSQLKEGLIDQCLLDEGATTLDLLREMKSSFPKKDWERSEGILYPSRYMNKEDTDDYLVK